MNKIRKMVSKAMGHGNNDNGFSRFHKEEQKNLIVRYTGTSIFMIFIWFVSGGGYFWPAWVIASFAISLLAREASKKLNARKNVYQQRDK